MRPRRIRGRPCRTASLRSPGTPPSSRWRRRGWRLRNRSSVLPARVLLELRFLLVVGAVALLDRRFGYRAGRASVVVGLELLERRLQAVVVDRDLVGNPNPVRALVLLHVEDVLVDGGRVVHDHD